jgi:hypothetical protein
MMASLCQRPMKRMLLMSILPNNMAMAPLDAHAVEIEPHGMAQGVRDILGLDSGAPLGLVVGGQWCTRRILLKPVVLYAPDCGSDGATEGVSTSTLDNFLVPCSILLCCESIGYRRSGVQFGFRAHDHIQLSVAHVGADIFEAKRCIVRSCACVLARAEQKEKGDANHVGDGGVGHSACSVVGQLQNVNYDDDWHWFHSPGEGVIGLGIRFELSLDPEVNTAVVVFPWVTPPPPNLACV